jgi:hypothetical protein
MLEFHVWELGRNVDCWVHVAERCCEDQVSAVERHLCHHAFCVWAFWHAFNKHSFNRIAKFSFNRLAGLVVLVGPAAIAHWADVDEANFGFLLCEGWQAHCCQCRSSDARSEQISSFQDRVSR